MVVTTRGDEPVVSAVVVGGSCVDATYGSIFVNPSPYFTVGFNTSGKNIHNRLETVEFSVNMKQWGVQDSPVFTSK